jgi:hypothetical protein
MSLAIQLMARHGKTLIENEWFEEDARNIRLGLATDGFNPFGKMNSTYSMWPVFLVPYNFPPWVCITS